MSHKILSRNNSGRYCAIVTKSVIIKASAQTVWRKISNFVGLREWVVDVKNTEFLSERRRGVGTVRKISFADGSKVVEYATGWADRNYLSYVATRGLPLDGYHATLLISQKRGNTVLRWTSFLISNSSDKKQFEEFLIFIEAFYANSLARLKSSLEKIS